MNHLIKGKLSIAVALAVSLTACGENKESTEAAAVEKVESAVTAVTDKNKEQEVAKTLEALPVEAVLSQVNKCNDTIVIRSQALTDEQVKQACAMLMEQESRFHGIFGTEGKPVKDDLNHMMRANVYSHRDEFVKHATNHFNMPTNNGGMYLEGYPDKEGNQAEFVAYQRNGQIWNLKHEYVHYLDGRFNKYGDYCNGLHDDHAGPEFCPTPHRAYPHIVWWAEGVAEWIAHGKDNVKAVELASQKTFPLSELFNTSSNENTGGDRVYRWGYLAVRFMMENHRDDVEEMLSIVRAGDWAGYQVLVKSWGTKFDDEFNLWLDGLNESTESQVSE